MTMTFEELVLFSFSRKEQRHWAQNVAPGSIGPEEAVERVAEVLQDQWLIDDADVSKRFRTMFFALNEKAGTVLPSDEELLEMIKAASTDYYAFQAIKLLAHLGSDTHAENLALRDWRERHFLGLIDEPKRPRGPDPNKARHRDMLIISQVQQLEKVGFRPTQSKETDRAESGCAIVAKATHLLGIGQGMTYVAVEGVWKDRGKADVSPVIAAELVAAYLDRLARRKNST